jgi:fatty acid desaturase
MLTPSTSAWNSVLVAPLAQECVDCDRADRRGVLLANRGGPVRYPVGQFGIKPVEQCGVGAVEVSSAAVTATQPTIVGALAFTFAALVATVIPLQLPWLPLLAPVTMLAIYVIVTQQFLGDRKWSAR